MPELEHLSQIVTYLGVPGAMAFALVYAMAKGWVVPGWLYREERARADRWEQRALDTVRLADDAVTIAGSSLQVAKRSSR